ncbi:MAG: hypothetical protein MK212_21990 [Saprospiraceae bacterium]|nr:hypothetical protein [Saprospiraceae bacterium]
MDVRQIISDIKVRVDDNEDGLADAYEADVLQVSDTYPFGWNIHSRSKQVSDYRYSFNGKEDDQEYGNQFIQDYGFRLYNPSIAKFLSFDPLSPAYPELTPYQFAGNTPIWAIDLDGLEPVPSTTEEKRRVSSAANDAIMEFEPDPYHRETLEAIDDISQRSIFGAGTLIRYAHTGINESGARGYIGQALATANIKTNHDQINVTNIETVEAFFIDLAILSIPSDEIGTNPNDISNFQVEMQHPITNRRINRGNTDRGIDAIPGVLELYEVKTTIGLRSTGVSFLRAVRQLQIAKTFAESGGMLGTLYDQVIPVVVLDEDEWNRLSSYTRDFRNGRHRFLLRDYNNRNITRDLDNAMRQLNDMGGGVKAIPNLVNEADDFNKNFEEYLKGY